MSKFIEQLAEIEKEFIAEATANTARVDMATFSVNIMKGHLNLRVECFDENDDTVVVSQEVNQEYDGSLSGLYIDYDNA